MLAETLMEARTDQNAVSHYHLASNAHSGVVARLPSSQPSVFEPRDRSVEGADMLLPELVSSTGRWPRKGGLAAWQLRRVFDYVEQHLDQSILIEDLAEITRLSCGHFCRAFKAGTNVTPHNYIVRERIRRAQRLMLSTKDSLGQIAVACGMTDQAHLTRLFRRFVDNTPHAWRKVRQAA